MKKSIWTILFILLGIYLSAQADYFQQKVDYKIDVKLNDQRHILTGDIEISYTNNSPDQLDKIYFHIWPNAYSGRKTAFAKQKVRQGDTEFYFADKKERGGISDLNFTVNGKTEIFSLDKTNKDIGVLQLSKPLKSGETISIKSPFTLKIPNSFSRLGHVEESYQMTQWYPKPAVYDKDGWHPMPYLDMGEFYSEFGNFEVNITLPENYVVAATGVLETASEMDFLNQKVEATNQLLNDKDAFATVNTDTFPASSSNLKTLKYTAENVHDFAWFADKRFYVQKSQVTLSNDKTVETWAFFTNEEANLWKQATKYLDRSVLFYSDYVGNYPYPHATAVQSALSAGGGMEYPMITVIGLSGTAQALDEVITHEVGHNWFYGILGFNERDHAWMDEGLNSYYDHRYSEQYYPTNRFEDRLGGDFFFGNSSIGLMELGYLHQARRHDDQAPETGSDDFKYINYWLSTYEKPAVSLKWLEKYWGTERYDQVMKDFYKKWKFRHPQPADFRQHLEAATDEKIDWLFDGLINEKTHFDYAIKSIKKSGKKYRVTIENRGDIIGPFPIGGVTKSGEIKKTKFIKGFKKTKTISIPKGDFDKIVIDPEHLTTDINRRNNTIKTSGSFSKIEPLRFKWLTGVENPDRTTIFYTPLIGGNAYDGLAAGLALHNIGVPEKSFEYALMPMYGFNSKKLIGMGELAYHWYPSSNFIKRVRLELGVKQFSFSDNEQFDYTLRYRKITPSITLNLTNKPNKRFKHQLKFRTLIINNEYASFAFDSTTTEVAFAGVESETSPIYELSYIAKNNRGVNPYRLKIALEQQSYQSFGADQSYLKATIDYTTKYTYNVDRNVSFRFFVGGFLQNTLRNRSVNRGSRGSLALYSEGFNDYKYEEVYFARSDEEGLFSQQIALNDGGMKLPVGASQAGNLGHSNNFIASINIKGDLPQRLPLDLPLKPYFDIGYFDNSTPIGEDDSFSDQLVYSGGLMLDFWDGMVGFYFPLFNSDNVNTLLKQRGSYGKRISFSINLKEFHPEKIRSGVEF